MLAVFTDDLSNVQTLIGKVTVLSSYTKGDAIIYQAQIGSNETFLIVVTGYGKVNTGFALGLAAMEYSIDNIIGVGNCGSLKAANTSLGDIAVSLNSIQFDVDYCKLGYEKGQVPGLTVYEYPCSQTLYDLAESCAKARGYNGYLGAFGSADTFVASFKKSKELLCKYCFCAVDNETACIGQLANTLNIPYVYIKGISNFADYNAPEMYELYKTMANEKANNVVYDMLSTLTAP